MICIGCSHSHDDRDVCWGLFSKADPCTGEEIEYRCLCGDHGPWQLTLFGAYW